MDQFDVFHIPVAQLEQNDCINKKFPEFLKKFEVQSTRLGKLDKTALADFLQFLGLKEVFLNHHYLFINRFRKFKYIEES